MIENTAKMSRSASQQKHTHRTDDSIAACGRDSSSRCAPTVRFPSRNQDPRESRWASASGTPDRAAGSSSVARCAPASLSHPLAYAHAPPSASFDLRADSPSAILRRCAAVPPCRPCSLRHRFRLRPPPPRRPSPVRRRSSRGNSYCRSSSVAPLSCN